MNIKQRKLVIGWFTWLCVLALATVYSEWLMDHKNDIRVVLGLGILLVMAFREPRAKVDNSAVFKEILEENSWIKAYFALYFSIEGIAIYYILSRGIGVGFRWAVWGLVLMVAPFLVVLGRRAYFSAGESK